MNKKYIFISVLFAVIITGLIYYLKNIQSHTADNWDTFEKTQKNKVKHYKTTKTELKKINADKKESRSPASQSNQRKLIGRSSNSVSEFSNTPSADWKKKLGENLLNHRQFGSKVFIKEVSGNIKVVNGKGRYVEKVIVTTLTPEGKQFSFNALADSETGEVLDTWNRTIHENFGQKPKGMLMAQPIY